MTRSLRLATFAVPLSGNKGSASMLLGLRDAFTDADIGLDLAVFSYYPQRDEVVARELQNTTVHPGHPKHLAFQLLPMIVLYRLLPFLVPVRWKAHIERLRSCDLVLAVGGTTFADSMLFKVPWNVLAALPGYMLGRPTVFVSQTMGPFNKWLNRIQAKWTLRRAAAVHGRGRPSAENVRQLGINAVYRPDLSFPMHVPPIAKVAAESAIVADLLKQRDDLGKQLIGIAPNSIVMNKATTKGMDYVGFLVGVIKEIEQRGYLPVLIPHSFRSDKSKTHNNDRSLCAVVLERLGGACECLYLEQDLSSQQLRSFIGELYILVASRFHSMVSALSMGVPPVTFGWGHQKYSEVLAEFRATELYCSYEQMAIEVFHEKLDYVLANHETISAHIREDLVMVQRAAGALPQELLEMATGAADSVERTTHYAG